MEGMTLTSRYHKASESLLTRLFAIKSLENRRERLRIYQLPDTVVVVRYSAAALVPQWALSSPFFNITRTADELSIVCSLRSVPEDVQGQGPWSVFQLEGPIPFTQTGVLASVLDPLAERRIGIFAISTFDTDYVLVTAKDSTDAVAVLQDAGHEIIER